MLMKFLQTNRFMAQRYKIWVYQYAHSLLEDEYFILTEVHVMARDIVSLSKQLSRFNTFFKDRYDGLYFSTCCLGDIFHMNNLLREQENKQLKIPF